MIALTRMDPISTMIRRMSEAVGGNPNITMSLGFDRVLDQSLLRDAATAVMRRHPILRSRVVCVPEEGTTYYAWEDTGADATPPVNFITLRADPSDQASALAREVLSDQNRPTAIDEACPFRLSVFYWGAGRTHLHLVLSHVAGDGRSLLIFFQDLLEAYLEGEASGQPVKQRVLPAIDPDWETLFRCPVNEGAVKLMRRPLLTDLRRQAARGEPIGDAERWPTVSRIASRLKDRPGRQGPALMEAFPRGRSDVDPGDEGFAGSSPVHHRRLTGEPLQRLSELAVACDSTITDALSVAYLLAQWDMAKERGESVMPLKVALPLDLRAFSTDRTARRSIGNFVTSIRIQMPPPRDPERELARCLRRFSRLKLEALRRWQDGLKPVLFMHEVGQPVPAASFPSLLKHIEPSERRHVTLSHLGRLDDFVPPPSAERLGLVEADLGSAMGSAVLTSLQLANTLTVSFAFIPEKVDAAQADEIWHRFNDRIDWMDQQAVAQKESAT